MVRISLMVFNANGYDSKRMSAKQSLHLIDLRPSAVVFRFSIPLSLCVSFVVFFSPKKKFNRQMQSIHENGVNSVELHRFHVSNFIKWPLNQC